MLSIKITPIAVGIAESKHGSFCTV